MDDWEDFLEFKEVAMEEINYNEARTSGYRSQWESFVARGAEVGPPWTNLTPTVTVDLTNYEALTYREQWQRATEHILEEVADVNPNIGQMLAQLAVYTNLVTSLGLYVRNLVHDPATMMTGEVPAFYFHYAQTDSSILMAETDLGPIPDPSDLPFYDEESFWEISFVDLIVSASTLVAIIITLVTLCRQVCQEDPENLTLSVGTLTVTPPPGEQLRQAQPVIGDPIQEAAHKKKAQPITENTDSSSSEEFTVISEKRVHFSKFGKLGCTKPRC
jgi:hypothetical protein